METQKTDYNYKNIIQLEGTADLTRKFMANVFMWMFVALGISAGFAYYFAHDQSLTQLLFNPETGYTFFGKVVAFSPFAFILIMGLGMNKIPYPILLLLFFAFSAIMGISLSSIFLAYSASLISTIFLVTSLVFGVMAIAGYTTNQDLTKFGSIMIMGLFGIVIATLVNMFILHSAQMDYIISYIGVAVFVGLTAYDVQKLKRIGEGIELGTASAGKMAVMGALTLYLDFINLFLMLLRVFGGRRR